MAVDPEAMLAGYPWRFDPETLREIVENPEPIREARSALTTELVHARSDATKARLYGLRAVANRVLRDLDAALKDGRLAVEHAEATDSLRRMAIARARLAHVYQWEGDFAAADRLYALACADDLPVRLLAAIHQQAGTCCYEQGRYIEACEHFERALELLPDAEKTEFVAIVELALEAVMTKVAVNGWGPYRRTRPELFGDPPLPVCRRDRRTGRWSYRAPEGGELTGPLDEAKPFSDGRAWVRRLGGTDWELIDQSGRTVLGPVDYPAVRPFRDGLCWVRAGEAEDSWQVIDETGDVLVPPAGFCHPHPFRFGVSVVCRGKLFGAIDRYGGVAVPFDFDDFCTASTDGRYVSGFTAEQLAVVDRLGRRGVIDSTGQVLVPTCYAEVYLHPIGYLIRLADAVYPHPSDRQAVRGEPGAWGALDRDGGVLIEPQHETRAGALEELGGMLRASRPVL